MSGQTLAGSCPRSGARALMAGCGEEAAAAYQGQRCRGRASGKRVHLIGFDASEPVIAALRRGVDRGRRPSESAQDGRTGRQDAGSASREATCRAKDLDR